MVELKEPLATLWRGKDAFAEVKKLNGEVFRELETRRTLRFELSGKSYFLKWHKGTTLKEIIKSTLIADARFGRRRSGTLFIA